MRSLTHLTFGIAKSIISILMLGWVLLRLTSNLKALFYPFGDVADKRIDEFRFHRVIIEFVCPELHLLLRMPLRAEFLKVGEFPVSLAAFEHFQSRLHW